MRSQLESLDVLFGWLGTRLPILEPRRYRIGFTGLSLGINLQMETVLKLWDRDPQQARAMLLEAKKLGTTALQEVRQSVATLRASPLPSRSLAEQVQQLLQGIQNRTPLILNTDIQISHDIPSNIQIAAYRILQEAMTNLCKHAKATTVTLKLWSTLEQLSLEIHDDGQVNSRLLSRLS